MTRQAIQPAIHNLNLDAEVTIVIPTFNERGNIAQLCHDIDHIMASSNYSHEIIIVDDNSPDDTAEEVQHLQSLYPIKLIRRTQERGLSSAVVCGIIAATGKIVVVMDADLSHPAKYIPQLIEPIHKGEVQLTLATRFAGNGGTQNWPLRRRIVSSTARRIAGAVTNVSDPTSGFFAIKRDLAVSTPTRTLGWKIALEYIARSRVPVTEIPFVFYDRKTGQSKLSTRHAAEFVLQVALLLLNRILYAIKITSETK
ncbi:MAG: polyprenol monophosphomannose synthase [bacterium]|nr:polyprenol monophosphomannose synthase [bacterium]